MTNYNKSWNKAPVGTVLMWWGDRDDMPKGWENCDGTLPHKKSKMAKKMPNVKKPKFIDIFPKGPLPAAVELQELSPGGSNHMKPHKHGITGLKVANSGEHSHDAWVRSGNEQHGPDTVLSRGDRHVHEGIINGKAVASEDSKHKHTLDGYVGAADGVSGDGNDSSGANCPEFQEIFFIIYTGRPSQPPRDL